MALRPPCELAIKNLIPNFRALIAKELQSRGYSQNKISKLLGVTQAAVNYYLKADVNSLWNELYKLGFRGENLKHNVKSVADYLANNMGYQALTSLCSMCMKVRVSADFCNEHYKEVPALRGCNICSKLLGEVESRDLEILDNLKLAIAILEHSRHFPYLIPEVNTNIVMAKNNARSVEDVAGIPGRIVRVGDRAKSVSNPRFGASRHLAKILLTMMVKNPNIKAAINLKFDRVVEEALKILGIGYAIVRSGPRRRYIREEELEEEISRAILGLKEDVEALVDLGGVGYEPSLYLFGEDAVDVAQKAVGLASAYYTISNHPNRL